MQVNIQMLAKANMVFNGKPFSVVQKPDWNGGHYVTLREYSYECGDFEYILWAGSPLEFAKQTPSFEEHYEPFHEEAYDLEITPDALLDDFLARRN